WEEIQHQASRAAMRLHIPYLISSHGMLDQWSLSQNPLMKKLYVSMRLRKTLEGAVSIHCTSEIEQQMIKKIAPTLPCSVIPNGVDLSEFEELPPRGEFRALFPEIGDRRILLMLGRIHQKKGYDIMMPALRKANLANCVLVIAGADFNDYTPIVKSMAQQNGVEKSVVFTGALKGRDRLRAFVDAELFVLPSYQENFGLAVVEALASGTPVIISTEVNIHEEVSKGSVGWVTKLDVDELSEKLVALMNDDTLRKEMAGRCKEFTTSRYDRNVLAHRWEEEYRTHLPWAQEMACS
ncbi:MAG: glycosyltransferase, partial [Candidatus Sumerlaeota bacterium]